MPWDAALVQPWDSSNNPTDFYTFTENEQIRDATSLNSQNNSSGVSRPYHSDGYLLISAGWDGEYGTRDDVTNFGK